MREPLGKNTRIKMDDGSIFKITGKPIGSGGLSLIYPAVELINGKEETLPYALKECYPENGFQRDPDTMEIRPVLMNIPGLESLDKQNQEMYETAKKQFLREKELTADAYIHSGRIIPVRKISTYTELSLDGGSTFYSTGNAYSVMDDLTEKGDSVKTLLGRKKLAVFQTEEALRITDQLLAALDEIHEQGLLHLDISEGNVFVQGSLKKETEQISLIDFGCARRRNILPDRVSGNVFFDSSEKLFSTSGFTPPEMKNDGCVLGPEADLYSAGCLLFHMLTGSYFERPTATDQYLTKKHLDDCGCPEAYRNSLQTILTNALAEGPKDRFPSSSNQITEMRRSVRKLLTDLSSYERIPEDMTPYSRVSYADERSIIHREKELAELEQMLEDGKNIVLMNGFGGVGKTSIAKVLYNRMKESNSYSSVGWLTYQGTLKESMLSAMDLYSEDNKEPDRRFVRICRRLRNDSSRKLLFIDNVDKDISYGRIHGIVQNPCTDGELQSIAVWKNMTVVITSRYDTLPGYKGCSYPVDYFKDLEACIDLFYLYYRDGEYYANQDKRKDIDIVEKLISRAGGHTYAIELLAKSAGNRSLTEYYDKICDVGFQFPGPDVQTDHSQRENDMAEQLKILFNLDTRTDSEKQLLWSFAMLPMGEAVTTDEAVGWFECRETDLVNLKREGWLKAGEIGYSMHMLVNETIWLSSQDAPKKLAGPVTREIIHGSFLSEKEDFYSRTRKLGVEVAILENVEKLSIKNGRYQFFSEKAFAAACFYTGYDLAQLFHRKEAYYFFEKSLTIRRKLEKDNPGEYKASVAEVCNNLGNLISESSNRRKEAEELYVEALRRYRELEQDNPGEYKASVAEVCNNLGILVSEEINRQKEAEKQFAESLNKYRELEKENPGVYKGAVAKVCNNLGNLVSENSNRRKEAEDLYEESLRTYRELEQENLGVYKASVAKVCNNLGTLISKEGMRQKEAEALYVESLNLRRELEKENPGVYKASVAAACNNLSLLISEENTRQKEAEELYEEALKKYRELEKENPDYYTDHLASICLNYAVFQKNIRNNMQLAYALLQEAYELWRQYPIYKKFAEDVNCVLTKQFKLEMFGRRSISDSIHYCIREDWIFNRE